MENEESFWQRHRDKIYNIAICLITGFVVWWFTNPTIEPVYYAWPTETVARTDSPHLSMKWDNEPIDTLCVARVAFWNQGKSSLSQDKLPSTDPLRISSSSPIKILSVETVNISRTSLPISYKIKPENKARAKFDDSIVFSIEGNDALEKDDGFAAKLLFTGDCSKSHLSVQGRVKSVGQIKQHEIAITFTTYAIALIFFIILSILYVKMFMHKLQAYNRSLEAAIIGPSLAWVIPLIFWIRILLHALPSWLP